MAYLFSDKSCYKRPMPKDKALLEAIDQAGGVRALARQLGIAHQAILQWSRAPVMRVLEIERLTGVSRYHLRPDIYPPEKNQR